MPRSLLPTLLAWAAVCCLHASRGWATPSVSAAPAGGVPTEVELCQAELPVGKAGDCTTVTYTTEADRLSVASGGCGLPAASQCVLRIDSPHPSGDPEMARVVLAVGPKPPSVGWWARRLGKRTPPTAPSVVRVLDVPTWEVQSFLESLDAEGFFVRAKPLTTDAFLAVERSGERFAKDFRSLPQLDALVLRVHQQGMSSEEAAGRGEVASRPPASFPRTAAAIGESAGSCHRLPPIAAGLQR